MLEEKYGKLITLKTYNDTALKGNKNVKCKLTPATCRQIADITDEEGLRLDGSYPSGHTAIGWAWSLILTEVFPEQTDVILERGQEFGISRNVCNVHWHSDVIAGRMMGTAAVARLHANEQFKIDLAAAKEYPHACEH